MFSICCLMCVCQCVGFFSPLLLDSPLFLSSANVPLCKLVFPGKTFVPVSAAAPAPAAAARLQCPNKDRLPPSRLCVHSLVWVFPLRVITSLIITNPSPFKCYFRDGFRSCCSSRSLLNPRHPLAQPIQRAAVIFMMPHNISLECVLKWGMSKKKREV